MTVPALLLLAAATAAAPAPGAILSLDDATRLARENQPQLRQARADSEGAAARADQARSGLLPQLTGTGTFFWGTGRPAPGGSVPSSQLTFSGRLSQLVWDFDQTTGRWRAARASAEAQRETEQAAGQQVLLGVRTAFFNARAARDLLLVARETLANQEAHLTQIQGFVEVGTRPEIDLAQARTGRANAQVQLINAENGYQVAKAQLNQAMGFEGSTEYEVASDTLPAVPGEDLSTDELLAEAMRARPDVAAVASQLRAREASLSAARGGWLPSLGVGAGVTETRPSGEADYLNWNATATLTWNLLQGGLTAAQVREAEASLEALRAQQASLRQGVRLEVDQARLAVRAARAATGAAAEALENARERLRLAEGRYQAGSGSALELGDAQLALNSAAAQKVQADYNLASARALMLRALGRP